MHNGGIPIEFEWNDYLELAKELSDAPGSEAKLRSSISRAYYASYCCARNYMIMEDHKRIPDNESKHVFIMRYFGGFINGSKKNRLRSKISIQLDRMRIRRGDADYEDEYPAANLVLLRSDAKKTISESQRVLDILRNSGI